jgi:hypothetical protein
VVVLFSRLTLGLGRKERQEECAWPKKSGNRNQSEFSDDGDANEQIYEIHWRIRDFQLRHEPIPPGKLARMPIADCDRPAESYNAAVCGSGITALIG